MITTRNADVIHKLRAAYQDHPVTGALQVFCVSNKLYWAHRAKPANDSKRYLELGGILHLRQYCIGIVAESYIRAVNHYTKQEIPTILGSASLWVRRSIVWLTRKLANGTSFSQVEAGSGNASAEKKQEILSAVTAIENKLQEVCATTCKLNFI